MTIELTGREIGDKCSVCKKSITEKDGVDYQFSNPYDCTCTFSYLNWHGATGDGKRLRDMLRQPQEPSGPSIHEICEEMEAEGFYINHTRPECKVEFRKRYDAGRGNENSISQN